MSITYLARPLHKYLNEDFSSLNHRRRMHLTHMPKCYTKRKQLKHTKFFSIGVLSIKHMMLVLPVSH